MRGLRILAGILLLSNPVYAGDVGVNDRLNPSSEPNAVHVGVCVGTDIEKREVVILDRLCLNKQAVGATIQTINELDRDRKFLIEGLNDSYKENAKLKEEADQKAIIAGLSGLGTGLTILGIVLGGLKAAGKL